MIANRVMGEAIAERRNRGRGVAALRAEIDSTGKEERNGIHPVASFVVAIQKAFDVVDVVSPHRIEKRSRPGHRDDVAYT